MFFTGRFSFPPWSHTLSDLNPPVKRSHSAVAAIKNFQISFLKHSSMLVSIMLVIMLVFDCGGEIVKVKNILLNKRPICLGVW